MNKQESRQIRYFIDHLGAVAPKPAPDMLHARYAGFAAVSAVSNLEQSTKDAFKDFAAKRHPDFGYFIQNHLESFNAQLKLNQLKDRYLSRFGSTRINQFDKLLEKCERRALKWAHVSIKSSYGNLIIWRHTCAHSGYLDKATLPEVAKAARAGEIVIRALWFSLDKT
ncbi:MAG: HEPN domain-containing protein [Pseudomonadota bacterium]|nr:HEPN domain-containing protein [Pseudomonadota bacterium]